MFSVLIQETDLGKNKPSMQCIFKGDFGGEYGEVWSFSIPRGKGQSCCGKWPWEKRVDPRPLAIFDRLSKREYGYSLTY